MPRTTRSRASLEGGAVKAEATEEEYANRTPRSRRIKREPGTDEKQVRFTTQEKDDSEKQLSTPISSRKRRRGDKPKDEVITKQEADEDDLPKKRTKQSPAKSDKPKGKPKGKAQKGPSEKDWAAGADMAASFLENRDAQRDEDADATSQRAAKNPYGLAPGVSPYPAYPHPTPDECHLVNSILQKAHGKVSAPQTIPTPSLNSSGCGEVPSVLDALVRTRLSAATNNANSSRAFRGLVERFGILKSGVGAGSVDWDAVRRAPQREVFEAIKTGGLADVKSRSIQQILEMVKAENDARRAELEAGHSGSTHDVREETDAERTHEITRVKEGVLSLDHLHLLDSDTAFNKLIQYPGIGPKTASCVLLFCMQRPSFAVDTHVFRLAKWLGWVPTEAQARSLANARAKELGVKRVPGGQVTREMAYAHLDVRVPDELKYPLHYLLIRHGRQCGWCSAKAGAAAKVGTCPLARLMKGKGRNKGLAKGVDDEDDEDDEVDEGDEDDEGDGGDEVDEDDEVEEGDEQSDADKLKDERLHGLAVDATSKSPKSPRRRKQ